MSRRARVVVAAMVVLVALGGVAAGLRLADLGRPTPAPTVDTDQPPREVVQEAGTVLDVMDHRLVTRVYVRDGNGGRDRVATYRHVRSFSDRQHLAVYRTHRAIVDGEDSIPTQFHTLAAFLHTGGSREASTSVVYATDGGGVSAFHLTPNASGPGAAVPSLPADRVRHVPYTGREEQHDLFGDVFTPHDARWRVVSRTSDTITYGIDEPYAQFEVRPTWGVEDILDGSRIRVTVDRETGRLERIHEERILVYELDEETDEGRRVTRTRRVHFVLETEVDGYGSADVDRPDGAGRNWQQLLADVLNY